MPGCNIKIKKFGYLKKLDFDYVLIFAWNFKEPIIKKLKTIKNKKITKKFFLEKLSILKTSSFKKDLKNFGPDNFLILNPKNTLARITIKPLSGIAKSAPLRAFQYLLSLSILDNPGPDGTTINPPYLRLSIISFMSEI